MRGKFAVWPLEGQRACQPFRAGIAGAARVWAPYGALVRGVSVVLARTSIARRRTGGLRARGSARLLAWDGRRRGSIAPSDAVGSQRALKRGSAASQGAARSRRHGVPARTPRRRPPVRTTAPMSPAARGRCTLRRPRAVAQLNLRALSSPGSTPPESPAAGSRAGRPHPRSATTAPRRARPRRHRRSRRASPACRRLAPPPR